MGPDPAVTATVAPHVHSPLLSARNRWPQRAKDAKLGPTAIPVLPGDITKVVADCVLGCRSQRPPQGLTTLQMLASIPRSKITLFLQKDSSTTPAEANKQRVTASAT